MNFDDTQQFTISAWINPSKIEEHKLIIACKGGETIHNKGYSFNIPRNYDVLQLQLYDINGFMYHIHSKKKINLNTWQHVACTWDHGTVKLFINGYVDNSTYFFAEIPNTGTNLYLGNNNWLSHAFWGRLDEIRIYDSALSEDEILHIYHDI